MMRALAILVISLGSIKLASPAFAQDKQQLLAELISKIETLKGQQNDLKNVDAAIHRDIGGLQQRATNRDREAQTFTQTDAKLSEERNRYNSAVDAHKPCQGTFTDKGYVDQCNSRKRDLDAWASTLSRRIWDHKHKQQTINEESESIRRAAEALAERSRKNQTTSEAVARRIAVLEDIKRKVTFDDAFLLDPQKRAHITKNCLSLTNLEQLSDCESVPFDKGAPRR